MTDHSTLPQTPEENLRPLLLPARQIACFAPLHWLALGWQDLKRAPRQSLAYGVGLVMLGYLIAALVWNGNATLTLFTLVTGLIIMGPALAFGLYSISRQLEMGLKPRLGYCFREKRKHLRNELLFALLLLIVLLVWARAASMVHVFFPIGGDQPLSAWLEFFAIGSAVGAIFAGIVFTISAFSLPLMLDKEVDAITGVLTSINAVLRNKPAMLVWAGLIVALMLLGFATAMLGLVVVLPLIGHATWHGYRETIITEGIETPSDQA